MSGRGIEDSIHFVLGDISLVLNATFVLGGILIYSQVLEWLEFEVPMVCLVAGCVSLHGDRH
jgi:hypothetical protein